jgi:hypothetical protein
MRQSKSHYWRKLAQPAQSPQAVCGACASAPVRQSPLGDGAQLAQQKPSPPRPGNPGKSPPLTDARLAHRLISPLICLIPGS